eukprot:1590579-Rhodomonas_salina.3
MVATYAGPPLSRSRLPPSPALPATVGGGGGPRSGERQRKAGRVETEEAREGEEEEEVWCDGADVVNMVRCTLALQRGAR